MSNWQLHQIVRLFRSGGIISYPAEAVWGLGCDPLNADAVSRLLALKGRMAGKGFILVASSLEQLQDYLLPLSSSIQDKVDRFWPGPVTLLLPARDDVPWWLKGQYQQLAVRVSTHPVIKKLCDAWNGPMISTSANLSGRHPAMNIHQVRRYFGNELDAIIPGELDKPGRPTPIIDIATDRVLRH